MNQGGNNLVFPKTSYKLMSLVFEVHNKIGNKWREKDFCNAFETLLIREKISYKREKTVKIEFEGKPFATCRLDFIIDNRIILEFKKVWQLGNNEIKQALRYLDAANLKLAILINIRHTRVQYIRVVNPKIAN